jgi:PAS domain S-box-containing protein
MIESLRKTANWLTMPAPVIENARQRQMARLLSSLFIVQFLMAILVIFPLILAHKVDQPDQIFFLVALVIFAFIYSVSRTRYYILSIWLYDAVAFIVLFVLMVSGPRFKPEHMLIFLIWPMLLHAVVLSILSTSIIALASIGLVLVLPFVVDTSPDRLEFLLVFLSVSATFVIIANFLQQQAWQKYDRQRTELADSRERYRILLDAGFETIAIYDTNRLLDVNRAFELLFDCSLAEALEKSIQEFIAPEARPTFLEQIQQVTSEPFETTGQSRTGQTIPLEVITKPYIYKGRQVRVAVFRNITERKKAEQQQHTLAGQKEGLAMLQQFISSASHDLRTPLTNLKASIYLLKRLGDNPDKREYHLSVLEKQTERLEKLLSDFLMMSQIDATTTGEFQFGTVHVDSIMADVFERSRDLLDDRSHSLTYEPGDNLPQILVDRGKITLALANILVNACNYTPDGGHIIVRTFLHNQHIAIAVQDDGIGIKPDDLPLIFDSFYRADQARSTDTGGSGLGLSIAKRIIERHQGKIEVTSTDGEGSTFTVLLRVLD